MTVSSQANQGKKAADKNYIRNTGKIITADPMDIERIIKECCEQLYAHKFHSLEEMDQFLERHSIPKFTKGEIAHLNSPMFVKEIAAMTNRLPK